MLTLCLAAALFLPDESDLTKNLALRRPTKQSTVIYKAWPSKAVDGNRNSLLGASSCTHSAYITGNWWQVDIGAVYEIRDVVITNRGDCCGKWKQTRSRQVNMIYTTDECDTQRGHCLINSTLSLLHQLE